jgi:uncharacterized protein YceK
MTVETRTNEHYEGPRTYSGTLADLELIGVSFMGGGSFYFLASAMDLPFSLVADTVLLPMTIPEEIARSTVVEHALRTDLEQPGPVRPIANVDPQRNAEQLFESCVLLFQRLDPDVTDCYSLDARVVGADGHPVHGGDYKERLRQALTLLHRSGGFVAFHEARYHDEGERVRIEATLETSFMPERAAVVLWVGPGTDGDWRILAEQPAPAWPGETHRPSVSESR